MFNESVLFVFQFNSISFVSAKQKVCLPNILMIYTKQYFMFMNIVIVSSTRIFKTFVVYDMPLLNLKTVAQYKA